MFETLKTLIAGGSARAENQLKDVYAIELIDQKIREVDGSVKAAKITLASLIQRRNGEGRQIASIETRLQSMTSRAVEALQAGRDDLAGEAAQAIANIENELRIRRETADRLDQKVTRLQGSLEAAHRRMIDLKQGAISAKAVRREQDMQSRLNNGTTTNAAAEAEELIAGVLGRDDPFEKTEILKEIDDSLSHAGLEDRMVEAGFGPKTKTTKADVLKRLQSQTK